MKTQGIRGAIKKFQEFFDIDHFVNHEFVPPRQSDTGHFYLQVLQRLRDAVEEAARIIAGTVDSASR
jgi:hypothetical protein